eukprot:3395702-Prymnesium_polylepis.1
MRSGVSKWVMTTCGRRSNHVPAASGPELEPTAAGDAGAQKCQTSVGVHGRVLYDSRAVRTHV